MTDQLVYDLLEKQATRITTLERLVEKLTCSEHGSSGLITAEHTHAKLVASDGDPDPAVSVDATGRVSNPYQTAFLAYNSVQDTNVTGDNTAVGVDFDTEVFDTGSDFDPGASPSSTFTAPVTGKYLLSCSVRISGMDSGHTRVIGSFATSNRTIYFADINAYACKSTVGLQIGGSVVADMDAGDTAIVQITVYGVNKVVDIDGAAGPLTWFSGALVT